MLDLTQPILTSRFKDVLFVTLNRPATRHALAADMVQGLESIAQAAHSDSTLRAIVLRGSNQFMELLGQIPVPVIALVEGAAMGGGMGLACLSDIVLATQSAKFVLSETSLGIVPAQIMPFVVDRIGVPASRRMGLTAERVSGELACQLGLVDALATDSESLEALLAHWLIQIGKCAPHANRLMKKMALSAVSEQRGPFLDQAAHIFAATMRDEGMTGIASFRAREPAPWCVAFHAQDIRHVYQSQGISLLPPRVNT